MAYYYRCLYTFNKINLTRPFIVSEDFKSVNLNLLPCECFFHSKIVKFSPIHTHTRVYYLLWDVMFYYGGVVHLEFPRSSTALMECVGEVAVKALPRHGYQLFHTAKPCDGVCGANRILHEALSKIF